MMQTVRKAIPEELSSVMEVLGAAKGIMRSSGNIHQWVDGYPSAKIIEADIGSMTVPTMSSTG